MSRQGERSMKVLLGLKPTTYLETIPTNSTSNINSFEKELCSVFDVIGPHMRIDLIKYNKKRGKVGLWVFCVYTRYTLNVGKLSNE